MVLDTYNGENIIFCMSRFNIVPSGDTLRQDAISSYFHIWTPGSNDKGDIRPF